MLHFPFTSLFLPLVQTKELEKFSAHSKVRAFSKEFIDFGNPIFQFNTDFDLTKVWVVLLCASASMSNFSPFHIPALLASNNLPISTITLPWNAFEVLSLHRAVGKRKLISMGVNSQAEREKTLSSFEKRSVRCQQVTEQEKRNFLHPFQVLKLASGVNLN